MWIVVIRNVLLHVLGLVHCELVNLLALSVYISGGRGIYTSDFAYKVKYIPLCRKMRLTTRYHTSS